MCEEGSSKKFSSAKIMENDPDSPVLHIPLLLTHKIWRLVRLIFQNTTDLQLATFFARTRAIMAEAEKEPVDDPKVAIQFRKVSYVTTVISYSNGSTPLLSQPQSNPHFSARQIGPHGRGSGINLCHGRAVYRNQIEPP